MSLPGSSTIQHKQAAGCGDDKLPSLTNEHRQTYFYRTSSFFFYFFLIPRQLQYGFLRLPIFCGSVCLHNTWTVLPVYSSPEYVNPLLLSFFSAGWSRTSEVKTVSHLVLTIWTFTENVDLYITCRNFLEKNCFSMSNGKLLPQLRLDPPLDDLSDYTALIMPL